MTPGILLSGVGRSVQSRVGVICSDTDATYLENIPGSSIPMAEVRPCLLALYRRSTAAQDNRPCRVDGGEQQPFRGHFIGQCRTYPSVGKWLGPANIYWQDDSVGLLSCEYQGYVSMQGNFAGD